MLRMTGKQFEIFNAIVGFDSVDVMDYFVWLQSSDKMLFHDEAMLTVGMFVNINNNNFSISVM